MTSIRIRLRAPLTQLLVAATASIVSATIFVAARGFRIEPMYLGLCASLTLGVVVGIAAIAALLPWPGRSALAIWAAVNAGLALHPLAGGILGLLIVLALYRTGSSGDGSPTWGLAVALGLATSLTLLPHVANRLGLPQGPFFTAALAVLLCASVIGLLVLWESTGRSSARRPGAAALAFAGLLATALMPLLFPQQEAGTSLEDVRNGSSPSSRPDIILLILDTVRADHLSIYGYARNTTPALTRFLEEEPTAIVYRNAHSPGTWTLPAHASLFTGMMASQHSVRYTRLAYDTPRIANRLRARMTLAELLDSEGYWTAFIFANRTIPWVRGFERGFDHYLRARGYGRLPLVGEDLRRLLVPDEFAKEGLEHTPAGIINEHVANFLEPCRDRPCFVVANYMEAHTPYAASPPHAGAFSSDLRVPDSTNGLVWAAGEDDTAVVADYKKALYDEELLSLDAAIGDLLSRMKSEGFLDHAWLFITSDHGEAFLEHGIGGHGTTIHEEVTRIPLIVRPPGDTTLLGPGEAVDLFDVTATISSIGSGQVLGPGRDLRQSAATGRAVQIEHYPIVGQYEHATAVIDGDSKLIRRDGHLELYDLATDPMELKDLAAIQSTLAQRIEPLLPIITAPRDDEPQESLTLSKEEEDKLRALGYVGQ